MISSILAFLLLFWAVLQTSWAQNIILNQITKSLSKELNTVVSAKHVKIHFFDHLELQGLYVEDQQGDTMFYIDQLEANYKLLTWSSREIGFDEVKISNGQVNLSVLKGENSLNIQFFIDYFQPKNSNSKAVSPKIWFSEAELFNMSFHYTDQNIQTPTSRAFHENDILFTNINAKLHDFEIINDSLHFNSRQLSAFEQSGLEIIKLKAICTISSTVMNYEKLTLITNRSTIQDHIKFSYSSYRDFADFISSVNIEAELDNSEVHSKDLLFFSNNLKDYDDLLKVDGEFSGTIDRIKGRDLNLEIGSHTKYQGDARITGLPDIEHTYWDFNAEPFKTQSVELARLIQLTDVPSELKMLGQMTFNGSFKGFLKEFVSYGELQTSIGNASTDVKFKINPAGKEVYSGTIATQSVNLGKLLGNKKLGDAGFELEIAGEGLKMENMNASVKGTIKHLSYNNYSYKNISMNGKLTQDIFEGLADINDPNLQLSFDGKIDVNPASPKTTAKTVIKKANLQNLGIDKNLSFVSLIGEVDLQGGSIDELEGSISLDSLKWWNAEQTIPVKYLQLVVGNDQGVQKMDIQSELLDASLKGEYKLSQLSDVFTDVIKLAQSNSDSSEQLTFANLVMYLNLKRFHPLYEQYLNGFSFTSANLDLSYLSSYGQLKVNGLIDSVKINNLASNQVTLSLNKEDYSSDAQIAFKADGFELADSLLFYTVSGSSKFKNKQFEFNIEALRDSNLSAYVDGYLTAQNDSISVYINKVDAHINQKLWHMGQTDFANIVYSNGLTELFYFDFRNNDEIIFFDGAFGQNTTKVNAVFDQFLLSNANPFLAAYELSLGGIANGYIDLTYREGFPIFESDFVIDNLTIDDDTLGNFIMLTESGESPLDIFVDGRVESGLLDGMKIDGHVDFNTPANALNLSVTTENSSVKPFEKYLDGLASNLSGYSKADLRIIGSLDKPKITGTTEFSELAFKVDYLQTSYKATATVEVGNNYFKLKKAELIDRFGHKGDASGQITHDNYSKFNFDLNIKNLENFECLNTSRKDNELFYGTAFADGFMEIKGPLEDILLVIRAKSRKGTKIYIPLDNLETDGQLSYVQFVDLRADNNKLKELVQTTEGVQMDFNFEITNDADVELIFDELLGDKIKGNGHGNLRMEVNTYGEFNMYGEIIIDKGDYLFTAFNFINKYFVVTPGSKLSWDGDPYNAIVDLEAVKREYPLPSSLLAGMVDVSLDEYNTPIPVDCELKLTGLLFNPDIAFGISFPTQSNLSSSSSSTFTTVMERIRQDPEELDRQVFALLALGTFIPPSFANSSGIVNTNTSGQSSVNSTITNSVNNSLSDFVSSQLSNWLSQIDPRWQVGIDYQIATTAEAQAELILSLKRKFLDDRLELQGSYDAGSTTGSRPYDLNVQYNLSKDGSFKIKGFQRNANDPTLGNLSNVTTSGIGLFYRHQFDRFWWEKK